MSKNKFRKIISMFIAFATLVSCITFCGISANAKSTSNNFTLYVSGYENYKYCREVISLVNKERKKRKLKSLSMPKSLLEYANGRAAETSIYFSHTRPDGSDCLAKSSYSGENIALGSPTPKEVVKDWMNSSGHRENILNPNFNSVGIGCFQNTDSKGTAQGTYWVQSFVSYKSKTATVNKNKELVRYKIKCIPKYAKIVKNDSSYSVKIGKSTTACIRAKGLGTGGLLPALSFLDNSSFNFSTSNKKIATVDKKGIIKGISKGKCKVTAAVKGTTQKASFTVYVMK